jgi:rhodanese-related sulfurtransferase
MNSSASYAIRTEALAAACEIRRPGVPLLSPSEFLDRSWQEPWTTVDARSPEERHVSIIPGALSKEESEVHLDEHPQRPVLVYCTAGCRSGAYAKELRQRGINAFNLRGGVLAWALNGGPFVEPNGQPTARVHVHGERWNVLPPAYEAVR